MKKLFYILSFILFTITCIVIYNKDSYYEVLNVKSYNTIQLDLNHNKSFDNGEEIVINDIKITPPQNFSEEENFIYTQLANNFAKDFFFNKKVQIKKRDLIANKESYVKTFNKSGFNKELAPNEHKKLIDKIKTNKYYIVNLHNFKHHKYGCKHYLRAEKFAVFEDKDLPLKSEPCRYCLKGVFVQNLTPLTQTFTTGNFKLLLTDHSTQLIPQKNCSTTICKELVSQINNAKTSIDFAIYGYSFVPEVDEAISNAQRRGVKIRMVYDLDSKGNTEYSDSKRLANLIKNAISDYGYKPSKNSYSNIIMHNKFFVFDNETVFTGSANLSPNDMSGFNSNASIIINSPEIAKIYTIEFEKMYSGKFHNAKQPTTDKKQLIIGSSPISVHFSPQDKITKNYLIPIIKNAQTSILIPTFLITDKWFADELITAHQRGVKIKIILDASSASSPYSQIKTLRNAGIEVKVENFAGKLHSKSIIIDNKIVVIGSMNISKSGQNYNDENVVIITNQQLAQEYTQFFYNLWNRIDSKWLKFTPRAEGKDSIGSCKDGIDNDYDGLIDANDTACQ